MKATCAIDGEVSLKVKHRGAGKTDGVQCEVKYMERVRYRYKYKYKYKYLDSKYQMAGVDLRQALLEKQNYQCGICKTSIHEYAHLDHDHDTEEYRGLLCAKCNRGLGLLGDNIESIESAIQYLKTPPVEMLLDKK